MKKLHKTRSGPPFVGASRPFAGSRLRRLRGLLKLPGMSSCAPSVRPLPSAERGFSLIEVLIAILILAFGVVSMGGLQLASLKSNQVSGYTATAATLVRDYTEMMQSNPSVSTFATATAGTNPYLFDSASTSTFTATPSVDCKATACSPANLAIMHVSDWASRVQALLPQGRAVVCLDESPKSGSGWDWNCDNAGTMVTVKIGWFDKRADSERGTTTYTVTAPQMVMTVLPGVPK